MPLTIKHILGEYPSYPQTRRTLWGVDSTQQDAGISLRNILQDRKNVDVESIMKFLKTTNIYEHI